MKNQSGPLPQIIQGGMGVNISSWQLARTVSMLGQQGTVSGTALEIVVAYILSMGDVGGHIRRALSHFPFPKIAESVLKNYFIEGGLKEGQRPPAVHVWTVTPSRRLIELTICANYAIVWLAKEGHNGIISINYLEKIAMPHIYAVTGSMLAGVDVITMGAGMPDKMPAVIEAIYTGNNPSYRLPVKPLATASNMTGHTVEFNTEQFFGSKLQLIKKPKFIPIISSNLLAKALVRKIRKNELSEDSIFGFVIEEPTAGGHNAPPRSGKEYGEKDDVDYTEIVEHGLPFWIGGSYADPENFALAIGSGASGIQAGTIFALSEESGMDPTIRQRVRKCGFNGELVVNTDFEISPTGFPFKVAQLSETISDPVVYQSRKRICDKGQLVTLYERADGKIGYRCPSEPLEDYKNKGGLETDTVGRGCICNGLSATAGMSQTGEIPIITLGDDVTFLIQLMSHEQDSYSASQAIEYLLGHK